MNKQWNKWRSLWQCIPQRTWGMTKTYAYLPAWRQETQEDAPLDSISASPKPYLNSEAQASFNMKAKIKHVLLPHVLPHHDQLNKNLDGGAVMWIFLKTPQLILIYSQSWVETYHSIFLSFQGECDEKKRIQVRGGAKVEMGKLDKLIFQEWNFHLVPQHASKVHF